MRVTWLRAVAVLVALTLAPLPRSLAVAGRQVQQRFGGAYVALDARRQGLVDNWVARFVKATGQRIEPGPFYDDVMSMSTKTTFEAVTHALMTSVLTDSAGAGLGDALTLVAQVDSVRGEVSGAKGDRQFRIYVRLADDAFDRLERSQQFKRGADNTVYHKGFPINYRAQGGVPSIQISIAQDKRRADIDVDYRSSSFPAALVNGHLTASNSDVRAGNNIDRHNNRWSGLQSWWSGFFGVRQDRAPETAEKSSPFALPSAPRAGKANIDVMVDDFLKAWLVEGDIVAAMGYVSERSYSCLARDSDEPQSFDRGIAPYQLMVDMKAAHDSLGPHRSLEGLVTGTRLAIPELRVVTQPHHAQFVIYSVPDDRAAAFDCEGELTPGDSKSVRRAYGNYFGATFFIAGRRDSSVALLWARDGGYWKIVSWKVGMDDATIPEPEPDADAKAPRLPADPALVTAAREFLDRWLIRKDYDGAFHLISSKAYACYDLERGADQAAATSAEDAGRKLRAALEASGRAFGPARSLDAMIEAAEPLHPAIRILNHRDARTFTLSSIPNALADAVECAARAAGGTLPDPLPLEYGSAFGMTVRFKTRSGETPVLRLLWRKESSVFRITSYGIELP